MFAKRRKRSEKWVVDENNVKNNSSFYSETSSYQNTTSSSSSVGGGYQKKTNLQGTSYQAYQPPSPAPPPPATKPLPPSYTRHGAQRVENLQKMNEIQVTVGQAWRDFALVVEACFQSYIIYNVKHRINMKEMPGTSTNLKLIFYF